MGRRHCGKNLRPSFAVLSLVMIGKIHGHGRNAPFRVRMPHNHHLDILVTESLWWPVSHRLLQEEVVQDFAVWIQGSRRIVLTLVRCG